MKPSPPPRPPLLASRNLPSAAVILLALPGFLFPTIFAASPPRCPPSRAASGSALGGGNGCFSASVVASFVAPCPRPIKPPPALPYVASTNAAAKARVRGLSASRRRERSLEQTFAVRYGEWGGRSRGVLPSPRGLGFGAKSVLAPTDLLHRGRRRRGGTCLRSFPGAEAAAADDDASEEEASSSSEIISSEEGGGDGGGGRALLLRALVLAAAFLAGFRFGRRGVPSAVYDMVDAASRRALPALLWRRPTPAAVLATALVGREVWRLVPSWAKARIGRRISRLRRAMGGAASEGENGGSFEEEEDDYDPDDMTSYGNLSAKLQGLLRNAAQKLPPDRRDADIQAPSLALLQLVSQLRLQSPQERDRLYDESGEPGTAQDLEGLAEGFEFADWAYDEDPNGIPLKENLERLGFCLVRHDKTTVPGYVGHYVAIHPGRKLALIGVKGTSTIEDLLTDCCGRAVTHELDGGRPFVPGGKTEIRCHEGILISARRLADDVQPLVEELFLPSGYSILITGHSLGAGASALLGIMMRSRNPKLVSDRGGERLRVWAYASPPVLDFDSAVQCAPFVTTIVNNADVIPRASLSNLLILLGLLDAVDDRLEERGIRRADGRVDSIALLKKLGEGSGGEMIMTPREMADALERAQEGVKVQDPDHLFVPGRVISMYSKWEEERIAEERAAVEAKEKKNKKRQNKGGELEFKEDVEVETEAVVVAAKTPEEYVRISDGNMKILRQISLDQKMIEDHLAFAYRKSLKELTAAAAAAD